MKSNAASTPRGTLHAIDDAYRLVYLKKVPPTFVAELKRYGLALVKAGAGERLNDAKNAVWVKSAAGGAIGAAASKWLSLQAKGGWVAQVRRVPGVVGLHGLYAIHPGRLVAPGGLTKVASHLRAAAKKFPQKFVLPDDFAVLSKKRLAHVHIAPGNGQSITDVVEHLQQQAGPLQEVAHDIIPMTLPYAAAPSSDEHYVDQWNVKRNTPAIKEKDGGINVEPAWDVTTGDPGVRVCIVDDGVDFSLPQISSAGRYLGYDAGSDTSGPSYGGPVDGASFHGTAVAGIAAATWDNGGIAGIAGGCRLYSVPVQKAGDPPLVTVATVVAALNEAANTDRVLAGETAGGRRVILLSCVHPTFAATGALDTALHDAKVVKKCVVVMPAGNDTSGDGTGGVTYPADSPHVISVGAVDRSGERVVMRDAPHPDATPHWSSRCGAGLGLVAPGIEIPTTDVAGTPGYNSGLAYPDDYADRNFHKYFQGTCAAAAHVAGVAGLLRSKAWWQVGGTDVYLTPDQVERILMRTAVQVKGPDAAPYVYVDNLAVHVYGAYNETDVGYGRVDADRALTFADVYIKDTSADDGTEPSTGQFWAYSDVFISKTDYDKATVEASFDTLRNDAHSMQIDATATNYAYVRVYNDGPAAAVNVRVRMVIASCSTGFKYPRDWKASTDSLHIATTAMVVTGSTDTAVGDIYTIATMPAKTFRVVRFVITGAQAQTAKTSWGTHICGLTFVKSDNDYAFNDFDDAHAPTDTLDGQQQRRNNVTQRNLTVVNASSPWVFPFLAGNFGDPDTKIEIEVDATGLPPALQATLLVDDPKTSFPHLDFDAITAAEHAKLPLEKRSVANPEPAPPLEFLSHAQVRTSMLGTRGVLEVAPGTKWQPEAVQEVKVDGKTATRVPIPLVGPRPKLVVDKKPHTAIACQLKINRPDGLNPQKHYQVTITQRDARGVVVGGITLVLVP